MKKILIVEDEASYLKLLSEQLSAKGYEISQAVDGKMGLEKVKEVRPDLILLDIRMPVMDGMGMLTELRKIEAIKDTKVIMLTNLEPDNKILYGVMQDLPSYYCIKSDTKLSDLLTRIELLLATTASSTPSETLSKN